MNLISLKARILLGAVLWTVGLFTIAVFIIHFSLPPPSVHGAFQWAFRYGPALALVAALCMLFGFLQVRRGLSPINQLRDRLAAVHKGAAPRVGGSYPAEVQPLVDDLNALLEERERRVARAVAKASDLAHGLKTPLAVLAKDIDAADAAGERDLAASMRRQVERMRKQIDWHLAQARATAGPASGAHANIEECARGLARALERLYADRALAITVDAPADAAARVPAEDLEEMLGNLLDNACKWARSRVSVTAGLEASRIVIDVDDDGMGLDPAMRDRVLRRGVRADEGAPGSGLGLAIVRELAEAYGGAIALDRSPMGGVRARLFLPIVHSVRL